MLEIKNLNFKYKNSEDLILDGLNFTVGDKELVSLIGSSGCGKTTLVNIIAGYLKPGHGKIVFNGKNVLSPSKKIVVINQEDDLFFWMTVQENMEIVCEDKNMIEKYLQIVGLEKYRDFYPKQLSGGMKKRLSLARVLVLDSDFIIMDEPFGSQDIETKRGLQKELLKIAQNSSKSILLITHDIEEAIYLSDRVLVLAGQPAKIASQYNVAKNSADKNGEYEKLKTQLVELGYKI